MKSNNHKLEYTIKHFHEILAFVFCYNSTQNLPISNNKCNHFITNFKVIMKFIKPLVNVFVFHICFSIKTKRTKRSL